MNSNVKPHFRYECGYWIIYYRGWKFLGVTVEKAHANFLYWLGHGDLYETCRASTHFL